MKNVISSIVICIFTIFFATGCATKPKPAAVGLKYSDFPPALQQMIGDRIAEANSNGGVCIAGRIKMSDGAHISSGKDVKINLNQNFDAPLWVYNDGWFLMDRAYKTDSYPRPTMLSARAFGYDPIDISTAVMRGQMTYFELVMNKTPEKDLAEVNGVVSNDQNEPFSGIRVSIGFPFSSHGMDSEPYRSVITDANGRYDFKGLSGTEHRISAGAAGYSFDSSNFTPCAGEKATRDMKLYRNLKIVIDYVYQADGNRSFTEGNIKNGTIEWGNGPDGVDFSEGKVTGYNYNNKMMRDLDMRQYHNNLVFNTSYGNGKGNGFYDAGETDFESVTEAAESGYTMGHSMGAGLCVVGHVYVVKTFENNYAKFIVRSISVSK